MSAGQKNLKTRLQALFEQPHANRRQVVAAVVGLLAAACLTACTAAELSDSAPAAESLPQNGLEQIGFLQQTQQNARTAVPDPMPEPEEKPQLSEGQASVKWVREEQSVAGAYSYIEDDSLSEGQYVIDRSAADGLDEVSGWAFYDEQGLLTDYQEMDRIALQAPVEGIVRYNGELEQIQSVVETAAEGSRDQSGATELTFMWPVSGYTYVSRWMSEYHKGADIVAPKGTPVLAMAAGTVKEAGEHYSYGNYVVIDHGNGTQSLYAHLNTLNVGVDTQVEQGTVIGTVGSTGNVTGNACHVEVRINGKLRDLHDWFPEV